MDKIISQVQRDITVPIMSGFGETMMYQIDSKTGESVYYEGAPYKTKYKLPWVNIVGIKQDKITGTSVIEIASWRKKYWLDFDEYYNNSDVLDGGIWID